MKNIKIQVIDSLFSRLLRWGADWKCERCGAQHEVGSRGLHASHFIGRANRRTRWDARNIDVLCWGCHQYMETHKATEYRDYKIKQLGEKGFLELVVDAREIKQWTPAEKEQLKEAFKEELKKYE